MALTITNAGTLPIESVGSLLMRAVDVDFDSSYPTGGESLNAAELGFASSARVLLVLASPTGGHVFEYDYTNLKLLAFRSAGFTPAGSVAAATFTGTAPTGSTINVTDDDAAAATGVAIYVHIDEVLEQGSYLAHLECVNAGNADSYFAISNGGAQIRVQDDDNAATGGLQLYFDEDGTAGSARFIADLDNVGDADVFVMASNGELLRINDVDTPSTPGVALYFDDDAANDYERLLFVSPTDADGSDTLDANVAMRRGTPAGTNSAPDFTGTAVSATALVEVANATDLSTLTNVRVLAFAR